MSGKDQTAGSEFDAWMGAGPSVAAMPEADEAADTEAPEVAKRKAGKGKGKDALAKLIRKPLVLIPALLAVAVVGLMAVRGGGSEPSPAEGQYASIATTAPETLPTVDPGAYDQLATPADEPSATLDAAPEIPPASEPTGAEDTTAPGDAAPEAASEPEPVSEPAAASEPEPESQPTRQELELRIAALENDLDRAQQTRAANLRTIRGLRAEIEKSKGQGSYSVVAVLDDGVVVRDSAGSERVYGLGARIGE